MQKEANDSPSPFAKTLAPSFIRQFDTFTRVKIVRALFDAAMEVADHGPDAIAKTSDPAGEGPFKYRALANGFELSSELREKDGKPVTLIVGSK